MDRFPVTKAEYAAFLNDTGYPAAPTTQLAQGLAALLFLVVVVVVVVLAVGAGAGARGWGQPVTRVVAGGEGLLRLGRRQAPAPLLQWQLAAQGGDFPDKGSSSSFSSSSSSSSYSSSLRPYPWGDELVPANFPPPVHDTEPHGRHGCGRAQPCRRPAFGVSDLVGNVVVHRVGG